MSHDHDHHDHHHHGDDHNHKGDKHHHHHHEHGPKAAHIDGDRRRLATAAESEAYLASRKEGGIVKRFVNDVKARLGDGVHFEEAKAYFDKHGNQVNPDKHGHAPKGATLKDTVVRYKVPTLGKIGIVAGATAMMGVAIHGAQNLKKGAVGWHDDKLDIDRKPDAARFLIGATEVALGLAITKRVLTGHFKL
jgi:hypothetical protein